ncbi:hypothetical protein J6590_073188 [Homalodisca vitripennis]|nr:hypothetical protein J6590_073188 [Homalodisca vitripennis]
MSVLSLTYLERRRKVCSGLSDGTASETTAHLQGTAGATNIAALVVPLLTFVTPEPAVTLLLRWILSCAFNKLTQPTNI